MGRFLGILVVLAAVVAGALWYLSSPDIPRATLEAKYGAPAGEFVMLPDGARAHYRERGDKAAPALLLLHGSNASLLTWEPWSKNLSDKFHVVSVDLPGHGLTGAVPNGDYSEEGHGEIRRRVRRQDGSLKQFRARGQFHGRRGSARRMLRKTIPTRVTKLILVDAGGYAAQRRRHAARVQ